MKINHLKAKLVRPYTLCAYEYEFILVKFMNEIVIRCVDLNTNIIHNIYIYIYMCELS